MYVDTTEKGVQLFCWRIMEAYTGKIKEISCINKLYLKKTDKHISYGTAGLRAQ